MSRVDVRQILTHLLESVDQLSSLKYDHATLMARGMVPGDVCEEMCPTGEHEYVLRWRYVNNAQAAEFKKFLTSHATVELL